MPPPPFWSPMTAGENQQAPLYRVGVGWGRKPHFFPQMAVLIGKGPTIPGTVNLDGSLLNSLHLQPFKKLSQKKLGVY